MKILCKNEKQKKKMKEKKRHMETDGQLTMDKLTFSRRKEQHNIVITFVI